MTELPVELICCKVTWLRITPRPLLPGCRLVLLPVLGPTLNIYHTEAHSLIAVTYIAFAHRSLLPNYTMASTGSISNWRGIETRTKKSLVIETSPTPENISKCNEQLQSPLFGILPAEIRNDVFSLALLQYEDLTQPYPENDFLLPSRPPSPSHPFR